MGLSGLSVGLGTGCIFAPPAESAPTSSDLRDLPGAESLVAYFDLLNGAQYSTLSTSLLATGANPAVTLAGPRAGRPIRVEFPVGGALGTMQYAISFIGGGGTSYSDTTQWPIVGTSSAITPTVDLGDGDILTFSAGSYITTNSNHTNSLFEATVDTWKELMGSGLDLTTAALGTSGPVFDWFGVNCQEGFPSLRGNGSMLANTTGLANYLSGLNQPFYIIGTCETIVKTPGVNALRLWSASHSGSTNNSKNIIGAYATGPSFAGNPNRWGNQKLDSGTGSVSAYSTVADGCQDPGGAGVVEDWSPHVHEWIFDGTIFTHKIDGIIMSQKNWATAAAVSLDRLTLFGNAFGASAPTNFKQMWWKRFAIYNTVPSNDNADLYRAACA